MDTLLQDLKFAVRRLLQDKGFLVTAALTLALCIGANTELHPRAPGGARRAGGGAAV